MKPSEIALKSAEMIKSCGWTQGEFCSKSGVCLIGAINRSYDRDMHNRTVLLNELEKIIGDNLLICWNDDEGRTAEEVICVLMLAHANLSSRGL